MKAKKIDNHSAKGHLAWISKTIVELLDNHKINLAKQIILDELKKFPNDEFFLKQLSRCCFFENNYEEMLAILSELNEEKEFLSITIAAIKLDVQEKLHYLYYKYYYDYCLPINMEYEKGEVYRLYRYYLMKKYEPHLELDTSKMTYKERQLWQYNPENALDYIKQNYDANSSIREVSFLPNINIDELFDLATESIASNKGRESCGKLGESYIFHYPNCGMTRDGKICDYVIVSVSFNSSDVFNIRPSTSKEIEYYSEISEFINNTKEKPSPKIKVKSGLDRFKSKYNY